MRCADDTKGDRERPKQVAGKKRHLQSNASCKPERFEPEEVDVRGRTGKARSRGCVCLSPGFDASVPITLSLSLARSLSLSMAVTGCRNFHLLPQNKKKWVFIFFIPFNFEKRHDHYGTSNRTGPLRFVCLKHGGKIEMLKTYAI
jgi:hypothetical protein